MQDRAPTPAAAPHRAWLLLAAAGAVWLGLGRAVVHLVGRGYLDGEPAWMSLRVLVSQAVGALPLALLLFLGMGVAGLVLRRNRFGPLAVAPLAGLYAFLGWAFLTLRLPAEVHGHPGLDTGRGLAANAAAAALALGLATLLFLPLLTSRDALGARLVAALVGLSRQVRRVGLALAVPLLVLWAWPRVVTGPAGGPPNLILISIDTLRPDRVGAYGHTAGTTPNLDAFAAEALRFDHAFSHHPWTLTAHATMLTGLHPTAHGVDRDRALSPRVPTVAALLQDAGYATYGVADDNEWLNARYGYARGFQRYRQLEGGAEHKVTEVLDGLEDWVDAPFFLFAHFYDVHSDWDRLPYDADDRDHAVHAGWYRGDWEGCDPERGCASRLLAAMNADGDVLPEEERRYLSSLYDAGVATFDRKLGVLLDGLEAAGRFEDTVIVITSDHGEEFFEHGKALHGQHYDECLRVPLLVRLPGGARGGEVLDDLVGLVDLAPTLLELAGLDPTEVLPATQGHSLAARLAGGERGPRRGVLLDTSDGIFGLRTRTHAVLRGPGTWELYDLRADPGQTESVMDELAGSTESEALRLLLRELRGEAKTFAAAYDDGQALADFEADAAARMADLGYFGDDEPAVPETDLDDVLGSE